jgi:dephospho-CoA kinase
MKRVAITGNIGSGKSYICELFKALGIPVYHSDEEAKKLYLREDIKRKMIEHFGQDIYASDATLNRKLLSHYVFEDLSAQNFIESMLYPVLNQNFNHWAEAQESPYVLYESAIIFEKGLKDLFTATILISASEVTRMRRVMRRDFCDEETVRQRMRHQWDEEKKRELSDFVIVHDSDDDLESLKKQIEAIDKKIKDLNS